MVFIPGEMRARREAIKTAASENRREMAEALEFDLLTMLEQAHRTLRAIDRKGNRVAREFAQGEMDLAREALRDLYELPYLFEVDPT
jgi:hypothetical protein